MLSQPATKIFLKTTEPNAAEWVSKAIGKIEIERMRETHFDGSRDGRNFSLDRQVEPLVLDSEISGLENLRAFMKYGNHVARFSFPYLDIPATQPAFMERRVNDYIERTAKVEPVEAIPSRAAPSATKEPATLLEPVAQVKQAPEQGQLINSPRI